MLAKRLREMERSGLVERIRSGAARAAHSYRLTERGAALEPAIHALGHWGWELMQSPAAGDRRDLEWLLVATRRRYLGGADLAAELLVAGTPYHFILAGDRATIGRGPLAQADARIRLPVQSLVQLLLMGWPEEAALEGMGIEGDLNSLRLLVNAFSHPVRDQRLRDAV